MLGMSKPSFGGDAFSPAYYLNNFQKNTNVKWVGAADDVRAYQNAEGLTVIEWLCRYVELVSEVDFETAWKDKSVIKIRETAPQYYVYTLKSPEIPWSVAEDIISDNNRTPHFCIGEASLQFIGVFKDKKAIYIGPPVGKGRAFSGVFDSITFKYVK